GDDQVLLRDLLLHQLDDLRVDLEVLQVDRRNAVLLAEEVGELVLLDRSDLDQGRADAGAVLLLLLLRLAQLLDGDEVLPDEQFTESAGRHAFALTSEAGRGRSRPLHLPANVPTERRGNSI